MTRKIFPNPGWPDTPDALDVHAEAGPGGSILIALGDRKPIGEAMEEPLHTRKLSPALARQLQAALTRALQDVSSGS